MTNLLTPSTYVHRRSVDLFPSMDEAVDFHHPFGNQLPQVTLYDRNNTTVAAKVTVNPDGTGYVLFNSPPRQVYTLVMVGTISA